MISTAPALTNIGSSLLFRALAGEHITFTRIKVGDGELATGRNPEELTDLINAKFAVSIVNDGVDTSQQGLIALTFQFDNSSILEDFVWRELGLYAEDEDGVESLFAYANDGERAGTLRAINTQILARERLTLIIEIDDAENVSAVFSPERQYALAEDLNDHLENRSNPHHVTPAQLNLGAFAGLTPNTLPITFTEASSRGNVTSGETLATLFGKIKKVFTDVLAHLTNASNPHGVTLAQLNAAAATHNHNASDINAGILPTERGGTGVNSMDALRTAIGTNATMGVYTGDNTQKRGINLGFVPSAVLLFNEFGESFDPTNGICGGLAIAARGLRCPASQLTTDATVWSNQYTALLIGEDQLEDFAGFWVNHYVGSDATENIATNEMDVTYHYIAYR